MAGMKGLKKTRRIQIIVVAFLALGLSTALIGYAMKDGINFFRSPSQVSSMPPEDGEVFRLGGLVKVGTLDHSTDPKFTFVITDGSKDVRVVYIGKDVPPDLFEEGTGTIATGQMVNDKFEATVLLAKHDEKYMPKEVIDALKAQGVYKTPEQ
jgi:cytochrome c-type biogenesis protein CcmE